MGGGRIKRWVIRRKRRLLLKSKVITQSGHPRFGTNYLQINPLISKLVQFVSVGCKCEV